MRQSWTQFFLSRCCRGANNGGSHLLLFLMYSRRLDRAIFQSFLCWLLKILDQHRKIIALSNFTFIGYTVCELSTVFGGSTQRKCTIVPKLSICQTRLISMCNFNVDIAVCCHLLLPTAAAKTRWRQ